MNNIVIPEITISSRDLVYAVVLYLVCLGVVIVVSKYRNWLKSGLQHKEVVYWVLAVISIAVFLPAIWETGIIIAGQGDFFDGNPNRYMLILAAIVGPPFVIWRTYIAHNQLNTVDLESMAGRIANGNLQISSYSEIERLGPLVMVGGLNFTRGHFQRDSFMVEVWRNLYRAHSNRRLGQVLRRNRLRPQ